MRDVELSDFFFEVFYLDFLTTLYLSSEQLYVLYFNLLSQMLLSSNQYLINCWTQVFVIAYWIDVYFVSMIIFF